MRSWFGDVLSQLTDRIYVIDLPFFDHYVTLVKVLYVESFSIIDFCSLIASFQ
jgi:hypothetical protein